MADPRRSHVALLDPASVSGVVGESPSAPATVDPTLRVSALMVGQRSLAAQRRGRYVAGSGAHPARMAPDLAKSLIEDYTQPGDWVLDPLAGIGTTHVEAIHLGRHAFGVEIEPGWVALARADIALARSQGGTGTGRVITADATRLPRGIPTSLRGQFQLVLTSPPYGRTMHSRVEHRRGPLVRFHNRYGTPDPTNLAHRRRTGLIDGITAVLDGCWPLLARGGGGGFVAVVSRPWRRRRSGASGAIVPAPRQPQQPGHRNQPGGSGGCCAPW
jgi:hypothetical protein